MIIYAIVFVLFLNESYAGLNRCFAVPEEFDIDNFQYEGDPIKFACICSSSHIEFNLFEFNGSIPSDLVDMLDNGKGLSLLFHGVGSDIIFKRGSHYDFAEEWFKASGNNICMITYANRKEISSPMDMVSNLNKLVSTKRLEFTAKMARDLALSLQTKCVQSNRSNCLRHMSQVDVSGFSFGAHMAGRTAQYLLEKTGERVRMLLALDPSTSFFFMNKPSPKSVKREYADYVQVIHTSSLGIEEALGDTDIYVKFKTNSSFLESMFEKHQLASEIHGATATKQLYLIAEERGKGNGRVIKTEGGRSFVAPIPKDKECLVGIYGTIGKHSKTAKGKKFTISLNDRSHWQSLNRRSNANFDFDGEVLRDLIESTELFKNAQLSQQKDGRQ